MTESLGMSIELLFLAALTLILIGMYIGIKLGQYLDREK